MRSLRGAVSRASIASYRRQISSRVGSAVSPSWPSGRSFPSRREGAQTRPGGRKPLPQGGERREQGRARAGLWPTIKEEAPTRDSLVALGWTAGTATSCCSSTSAAGPCSWRSSTRRTSPARSRPSFRTCPPRSAAPPSTPSCAFGCRTDAGRPLSPEAARSRRIEGRGQRAVAQLIVAPAVGSVVAASRPLSCADQPG